MAIVTRHIFLDTEVFVANNFDYTEQRFETLIERAEAQKLFIHITDITEQEIYAQLRKRVFESCSEIRKFRANDNCRVLLNIGGAYTEVFGKRPDKNELIKLLEEQFESFRKEALISTINTDSVSISDIFSKYFSGKPPFGEGRKKDEFPDAFVIAALEGWCRSNSTKMYLISNDPDMVSAATESEYLISINKLDQLLDKLLQHEHDLLYARIHSVFMSDINTLKNKIKDDFEDGEFVLDEYDGEVDRVVVESINIYRWSIVNIDYESERVTIEANISIDYKADISYAEIVIEDVPLGHEEEEIERDADVSAEIIYVFNAQTTTVEFESLELRTKPIILYRGLTDEQLK